MLDLLTSNLASLLRIRHGSRRRAVDGAQRPQELLELYAFEACPFCRLVRERLTELDLDYVQRSCPKGDSPNRRRLVELGGKMQVPFLVDPNTGTQTYESRDILAYLDRTYGPGSATPRAA